jgi:hypothetical protein
MKTIIYLAAGPDNLAEVQDAAGFFEGLYQVTLVAKSADFNKVREIVPPASTVLPIPPGSPLQMPLLAAVAFAAQQSEHRAIFWSARRPVSMLVVMSDAWRQAPGCKSCTLQSAEFPLVPDGWGVVSTFIRSAARPLEAHVEKLMTCTRSPQDWGSFEAEVLRDIVWPRLKHWGHFRFPRPQTTQDTATGATTLGTTPGAVNETIVKDSGYMI